MTGTGWPTAIRVWTWGDAHGLQPALQQVQEIPGHGLGFDRTGGSPNFPGVAMRAWSRVTRDTPRGANSSR